MHNSTSGKWSSLLASPGGFLPFVGCVNMNGRSPKFAAGATRQRNGKPVYFISEVVAQEFNKQKC